MSEEIKKGLLGIVVDETTISHVVPELSALTYRGYTVQELCDKCDFEEVAYLVLNGELKGAINYWNYAARLEAKGFMGFGLAGVGFAYPMSQVAATNVSEVRKMKIWTPDNDLGALTAFEAFNISPIPLPYGDVLMGLQTGLINGIAAPPVGTLLLQWHTQVSYALDLPLLYVYGSFVISNKAFKKLSTEDRQTVSNVLNAAVNQVDRAAKQDDQKAKKALSGQGISWLAPVSDDFAEWDRLASTARKALVEDGYVSEPLYERGGSILEKIRAVD